MGLISPTTPTIGAARGDEEVDVRSAIIALLNEFNGNIDNANIKAGAAIDGAKLLAASVTAAKIEAQQAWQTQAFTVTGVSGTAAWFKDSLGVVHFRGDLYTTSASVPDPSTLFTLPVGSRPGTITPQGWRVGMFASGHLEITSAGVVSLRGLSGGGAGQVLSFGSVHFRAEN